MSQLNVVPAEVAVEFIREVKVSGKKVSKAVAEAIVARLAEEDIVFATERSDAAVGV